MTQPTLVLKQKLLSFGDDFYVRDESGRNVYFVDGKAFSIGDQLSFQDLDGNELAYIRQNVLSWGKTYEISRDGQLAAAHVPSSSTKRATPTMGSGTNDTRRGAPP